MKPFTRTDRKGWWIRFKDANGKWRMRKGGDTEGDAWSKLKQIEREAEAIREGWVDPRQVEAAKAGRRPIAEIVEEYRVYLVGKRNTPAHVKESIRCINVVVKGTGAKCLTDLDHGSVELLLGKMIAAGKSARTRNVYRLRINALMNWAVRRRMVTSNPIVGIEAIPEGGDKREISRAMTPEELGQLLDGTPDKDRRLYYLIAARTGLRWSEIARLRWLNVDLDGGWITPDAANTKSQRADPLPIAPDLLAKFKAIAPPPDEPKPKRRRRELSDLAKPSRPENPGGRVFKSSPTLRTFQRDLKRAGIPYETERGQVDRKSLRKTFGTHLAMAGVDFRLAVRLMRHTDPRLTMNVYTDPMLLDMKTAVSRLDTVRSNVTNWTDGRRLG